jgi:hypothetical protein
VTAKKLSDRRLAPAAAVFRLWLVFLSYAVSTHL